MENKCVFLDRDGVLIEDVGLIARSDDIHVYHDVPSGLCQLKENGFQLIVISNQTVIARGLLTENEMLSLNKQINKIITNAGGPDLDIIYYCPHHPEATIESYRLDCECRKPKPGLILQAAHEHNIDLHRSYLVGDRITDIMAGQRANCHTILVQTGAHNAPPIQTSESIDSLIKPEFTCENFTQASKWIIHSEAGK